MRVTNRKFWEEYTARTSLQIFILWEDARSCTSSELYHITNYSVDISRDVKFIRWIYNTTCRVLATAALLTCQQCLAYQLCAYNSSSYITSRRSRVSFVTSIYFTQSRCFGSKKQLKNPYYLSKIHEHSKFRYPTPLTFESLVATIHAAMLNIQKFYVLPTDCICAFCKHLCTVSSSYTVLIAFITETRCSLRDTIGVFK
jgi:hypothetical protein